MGTMRRPRFGVIMDIAFSSFQREPKLGIGRYLAEAGIDGVFFGMGSLNPNNPEERAKLAFFDFITPAEFDGLIVMSTSLINSGGAEVLKERMERLRGIPMVSVGPSIIGEESVSFDGEFGIKGIMKHLLEDHGYRRFAFVSGPLSNSESRMRLEAFRTSLDAAGIPHSENDEYVGNFMPPSGMSAVSAFMDERGMRPEAIVCANDLMALGVWNGLLARGLSVPHDVAVTGYDDTQISHALSHRFTTVRQPFEELGYLAAKRLHSLVRGEKLEKLEPQPTNLRLRTSCGCIEFERRQVAIPSLRSSEIFLAIKGRIISFVNAGFPESETQSIYRMWTDAVHKALEESSQVYELEEILRDISLLLRTKDGSGEIDKLLTILYSLLLEECGQALFVDYWKDNLFAMHLRVTIDQLPDQINKDLSLTSHSEVFDAIMEKCQARSFHVYLFNDGENPQSGASIVYSSDERAIASGWRPGPRSWFPESGGPFAANMIVTEDERFGFYLLDISVPTENVFETLRIRLSRIFSDFFIMKKVRQLNAEMLREIAAREASEKRLKDALAMVEQLSVEDELTHLHNRRGFLTLAEQQVKYLRREKLGFLVLFADLDGLKTINDRWGHKDGDLAIQAAAKILREALRDSDIIARLGGDEFTALVSNADRPALNVIYKRIVANTERRNQELAREWKVSISIGSFYSDPDCCLDVEAMLEKADVELYREKQMKKGQLA